MTKRIPFSLLVAATTTFGLTGLGCGEHTGSIGEQTDVQETMAEGADLSDVNTHERTEQQISDLENRIYIFIGKQYYHGIPFEDARFLGADALPFLYEVLGDDTKSEAWPNVVDTIGYIGESESFPILVSFLEKTEGEVDSAALRALLAVPYALSCIARNGDSRIIEYLGERMNQESWNQLSWTFRGQNISTILALRVISTISLSGQPIVRRYLNDSMVNLERSGDNTEYLRFFRTINASLMTLKRVSAVGTVEYLQRLSPSILEGTEINNRRDEK